MWIVIEDCREPGRIELNGRVLGALAAGAPQRFDATAALLLRNDLALVLAVEDRGKPQAAEPPARVCLEIEPGPAG